MWILVMDGAFCITSVNIIRLSYVKHVRNQLEHVHLMENNRNWTKAPPIGGSGIRRNSS